MATTQNLLLLPGDGIGPEVMAEVERFIAFFNKKSNAVKFETSTDLVGGAAYDKHGVASAYGNGGTFMQCEYQMNTPVQGAGQSAQAALMRLHERAS